MVDSLIHVLLWASVAIWQAVSGEATISTAKVLSAPDLVPTIIPAASSPTQTTTSPTPTPQVSLKITATPKPEALESDDCDFEYHYDSRDTKSSADVNINKRCQAGSSQLRVSDTSQSNTTATNVKNSFNIDVNTGGSTANTSQKTGDIKIDVSVKNNVK